ncbi:peptidase S24 [Sphingomonas sp. RB3P16]|uniref:peptidase S24 n=1 Tax=Parasphingomonas frigoris TaxID=3096163 RepID=UPI002FCB2CEA
MKPGPIGTPAEILERLAREQDFSFAALSRMLRRRRGYLADFVREGHPSTLPAIDRNLLAALFRVPAWWFGEDPVEV